MSWENLSNRMSCIYNDMINTIVTFMGHSDFSYQARQVSKIVIISQSSLSGPYGHSHVTRSGVSSDTVGANDISPPMLGHIKKLNFSNPLKKIEHTL